MISIAMISEHASPLISGGSVDTGGQNIYVAKLAERLSKMGFDVDVFTRSVHPTVPFIVNVNPHYRVIHITAGPPVNISKEFLLPYMNEFRENILHFIESTNRRYHLIHAHFFMSAKVAIELKKILNIPVVVTFHALGKVRRQFQGKQDLFPPSRARLEAQAIKSADAIIAECPQDKRDLVNLYRSPLEKLHIIPCGVDLQEFYPIEMAVAKSKLGLNPTFNYFVYVGRLVPRKGLATIIEGFAYHRQANPNSRLLIVGGDTDLLNASQNSEIYNLQQLAKSFHIDQDVIFVGPQSRNHLKYYYSLGLAAITLPWYEPFGITPLESMACGTPVIGSRVGGLTYTIVDRQTGYLIPPQDPQSLSLILHQFVSNPALHESLGQKGRQRVAHMFTWKKVAVGMNHLYRRLIQKKVIWLNQINYQIK